MEKNARDIWFPAKKYGIGWGLPVTWQGWSVLLSYIVLVILGMPLINQSFWLIVAFILYVFVLTAILIFICWKKGEKLQVRWGKE